MLTVPKFVDDVFAPSPRLRLNLSSYSTPLAFPLRLALIAMATLLSAAIAWDLLELWGLHAEVQELARSAARLREQDQRMVEESGREGLDLSAAATTRLPAEVTFVNRLVEKRLFSWTHFLSELERAVPTNVSVGSIRLDPNGSVIQLTGAARTFEDVTAFLAVLEEHREFHDPVLKQHRDREDGAVEFDLMLHYRHHVTRG